MAMIQSATEEKPNTLHITSCSKPQNSSSVLMSETDPTPRAVGARFGRSGRDYFPLVMLGEVTSRALRTAGDEICIMSRRRPGRAITKVKYAGAVSAEGLLTGGGDTPRAGRTCNQTTTRYAR